MNAELEDEQITVANRIADRLDTIAKVIPLLLHNVAAKRLARLKSWLVHQDPIAIEDCVCPDCLSLIVFDLTQIKKGQLCRSCENRGCPCGGC